MKRIILGIIIMAVLAAVLAYSEKSNAKVMSIHYCFQEAMDGTLVHYQCENNNN